MLLSFVYLDFLILFFAVPVIFLLIVVWRDMLRIKKTLCAMMICTAAFGPACDFLAIRTGLWRYDTGYPALGIEIAAIPLEEFLFYVLFSLLVAGVWCFMRRIFNEVLLRGGE